MKSNGVLLLSHVGFSFIEDLVSLLEARGLRAFILTSSPLNPGQRLGELERLAARLFSVESHVLTPDDIDSTLAALRAQGERVLCCISVWEGYRSLMARANAQLGVPDLSARQVEGLRDKLVVRNRLADSGLSEVRATALTPDSLATLKASGRRYFIKPRSGIASYGAFPMRADTRWEDLERIVQESAGDVVYESVFNGGVQFLAEDYLAGREFSFEVVIVEGRMKVVAIHEKCEVTELAGTVLENSCTSPPHSLDQQQCAAGIAWLRNVLDQLYLWWGCFHVEARFGNDRWDLIEINPRVGGSLISHSVRALTGECSMLELWLESLLAHSRADAAAQDAFFQRLASFSFKEDGCPPNRAATFFRVYYAQPGRIEYVGARELSRVPAITHVLLKAGDEVTTSAREVFLGQMLWKLSIEDRDANLAQLARESEEAIEIRYFADSQPAAVAAKPPVLLIVDYNLTRVDDVAHIAEYVQQRYCGKVLLIRANPSVRDFAICDRVLDIDPLSPAFVERAAAQLEPWRSELRGGIVFSDNAVQAGAALLERLGLRVDSAALAGGAFSKYEYRMSEARHSELFAAQRVMVPECRAVHTLEDLQAFANRHRDGFVIKPSCEGNNRGVIVVRKGNDLQAAFDEVKHYIAGGVICEQLIPYQREYSYDGIGMLSLITEKVSATGRYPVEVAQIQPARLNEEERATLIRAGRLANLLGGQCDGPFHNEIKLSDDGMHAAVVEPNRRPAGMKIWSLAGWVYGIDLYERWVDTVFGSAEIATLPIPKRSAATVMLGVGRDRMFAPDDVDLHNTPLLEALAGTAAAHGLSESELHLQEFAWLTRQRRQLRKVPRDNADFAAYTCILLESNKVDIREVVATLRRKWVMALEAWCDALEWPTETRLQLSLREESSWMS